jgi:Tfp pilus assembly protein PilO
MKAPKFWMVVPALLVAGVVGLAYAKLPQPPMDDAAKAKAAEAKAKAAEGAKKARAAEEKAMDRAVERYKKEKGVKSAAAPKKM